MKNLLLLIAFVLFAQFSYGQDTTYVRLTIDNNRNVMKALYSESGLQKFEDRNDFYDNNINLSIAISQQIYRQTFLNVNASTNEAYYLTDHTEAINGFRPKGRHILHQYSMDFCVRQHFLKNNILFIGAGGGLNINHSSTDLSKIATYEFINPTTMEPTIESYEPQFVANHPYFIAEIGAQFHYKSIGFYLSGHYKNSSVVNNNIGGVPNHGFTQFGTRVGVSLIL